MMLNFRGSNPALKEAACGVFIFLLNAIICIPLFRTDWVIHMFSIESAHISLTHYVMENFPDLAWFPLWLDGEPFQSTYQPGLPLLSAFISKLLHTDVAHGYHITVALFYCIGPVGIFLLAYKISGRREVGLYAAVFFSLLSPSALIPAISHDMGGFLHARRFQALAFYGEGPNVSGLSIVPFALLAIHGVYRRLTAIRFALAAAALALVVIVSWPAAVVLSCGVFAYLLSRDWPDIRPRLFMLAGVAITAYLLIAPLDLPSTIRDNQRNSQRVGGLYPYTRMHLLYFGLLLLALVISRIVLRRLRVSRLFEFGWYWFLIPGAVAVSAFAWHTTLLPQPERFHIGMELGVALFVASAVGAALDRFGSYRLAAVAVLCVLAWVQARTYASYVRAVERPIDIASTYEYQFARWLDTHAHGQRIFASGDLQFWLNAWSGQPQAYGCCLPGMPNPMSWIFLYIVSSPLPDASLEESVAELWLRTWGVQVLVENGPKTRDAYPGWPHPHKFDSRFTLIHEQGDDRIYRIPTRTDSLAHVVQQDEVISRAPIHGLDVAPLKTYVQALENPARPLAAFTWLNRHAARIAVDLPANDLISVQETWHPGWHAYSDGHPVPIRSDAMGFLVVAPAAHGPMVIDLSFDGGTEAKVAEGACLAAWAGLIGWIALTRRRPIAANSQPA